MTTLKNLVRLFLGAAIFQSGFICPCALALPDPLNGVDNAQQLARPAVVSLQDPHGRQSPAQVLRSLAEFVESNPQLEIDWDVYGDFEKDAENSFLRKFESEIASEFGMEEAVFMPSGVMAQSIALLIHRETKKRNQDADKNDTTYKFLCHESSHLLLYEQDSFRELLGMLPIVVSTKNKANGISVPPMTTSDVEEAFRINSESNEIVMVMIEVPHRELGGKVNTYQDLLEMRDFCRNHNVPFHCDGARIFEASTGYITDGVRISMLGSDLFDSMYVSCYKGLGGLSGAFLVGNKSFCQEARVWLRRMGGNLYTLLPYAVPAYKGYLEEWKLQQGQELSFAEKKQKLMSMVQELLSHQSIAKCLAFDPELPEINMIHGYVKGYSLEECNHAAARVKEATNIEIVRRFKPVDPAFNPSAVANGYSVMFEWSIGQANGAIDKKMAVESWSLFFQYLEN